MKLQLTIEKIQEIVEKGYNLDHISILKLIDEGTDISKNVNESSKIALIHQSLIRKGLVFETEAKLTTIGKELLVFIDSKDKKKIIKPKVICTEFDDFWEIYPRSDSFEYKGKTFQGSRSLRVGKDDCRTKFNKILLEGEIDAKQIVEALKLEVFQKKEKSLKEGSNKLSYMQNSLTWLNQRSYDGFIELLNSGVKITETKSVGATDI
jgi:hypothetical protein